MPFVFWLAKGVWHGLALDAATNDFGVVSEPLFCLWRRPPTITHRLWFILPAPTPLGCYVAPTTSEATLSYDLCAGKTWEAHNKWMGTGLFGGRRLVSRRSRGPDHAGIAALALVIQRPPATWKRKPDISRRCHNPPQPCGLLSLPR